MKTNNFENVIKRLGKYENKILTTSQLKKIFQENMDDYTLPKFYKLIYQLKNREYLQSIKKDIFFIKNPEKNLSEDLIIENHYRKVLKDHCKEYLKGNRYIGGIKALEFNLSAFDIPEEILIINQNKQAIEVILLGKQAAFKTYQIKEKNLFKTFYQYTKKIKNQKETLPIANLELSIIESLYNISPIHKGYVEGLIIKALKKNKKTLDIATFENILKKGKHNSSLNRLYQLSKTVDKNLSEQIKAIIKKYGYII